MAGVSLPHAEITPRGFAYDREWMLTTPDGTFLTQRQHPTLALIQPELTTTHLILHAPPTLGMQPLHVPLQHKETTLLQATVWESTVLLSSEGKQAQEWLQYVLGVPCMLCRISSQYSREIGEKYQRNHDQVSLADSMPFHCMNANTLADIQQRIPQQELRMDRFRANIIVHGAPAYSEDTWKEISIGAYQFDVPKSTGRCTITTINQQTAQSSKEPLRTLAGYRAANNNIFVGVYLLHHIKHGTLHLGDKLRVIEYKE